MMKSDENIARCAAVLKTNSYFCEFVKYLEDNLDYQKKQMIYIKDDVLLRIQQGKAQAYDELLKLINNAEDTLERMKENAE